MKLPRRNVLTACLLAVLLTESCASRGKIPVILDYKPDRPYEVIEEVETEVKWGPLQWLWFWWHYLPGYSAIYKSHNKKLVKKARKLGADAVIDIDYLPHRSGARGTAIRFTD